MMIVLVLALNYSGAGRGKELEALPEQTAYVEVTRLSSMRSGGGSTNYWVWFEFTDGTEKKFKISSTTFRNTFKQETGTLTY